MAGDVELAVVDEYDYVPLALPDSVVAHPLTQEPLVLVTAARAGTVRPSPPWPRSRGSAG